MPGERMTSHAGTIECLFCSCVISLRSGDNQKFKTHLEVYHEVFSSFDILLAFHFLRQEEAQNILAQVKHRVQEVMDTGIQVKQEMMNILEADSDLDCQIKDLENKEFQDWEKIDENLEPKIFEETDDDDTVESQETMKNDKMKKQESNIEPYSLFFSNESIPANRIASTLFSCNVCRRTFVTEKFLRTHTAKHSTCNTCGKTFKVPSKLRRHLQDIKRPCTDTLDCSKCGKIFKERRSQKRHRVRNNCTQSL